VHILYVNRQIVPAFYSIFRMQGMHLKEEIKPHPALVKLFQAASLDELTFDATLVPMVCPPLPWTSIRTGGYLLSAAKIVRYECLMPTDFIRCCLRLQITEHVHGFWTYAMQKHFNAACV